ncbi:MAG: beta-ketoacyl synthase, partial [Calditrichaeota bacterium]
MPDRWQLPESLRDETGIIFASAFPGTDSLIEEVEGNQRDISRRTRLAELQAIRSRLDGVNGTLAAEIDARIQALQEEIAEDPYIFDRRFLFRVLSMGHSQFAEYIGARGPNTQINAACASTTQAVSLAQDWILAGRCSRVVILAADNITSDTSLGWFGAGFLASGAAATEDVVEEVALPFDRRRHGMIVGMGGAALVVETPEKVSERGMQPIAQVLSTVTANSAFHGTRLDVDHICQVMENLVSQAERDWGVNRAQIAPHTVFVSHETYTPARGGSAAAEINALRRVFGPVADQIVISNTKGYTGHAMATGIEDVLAVKALETGIVPPVPNFKEIDPELGQLNISKGGNYPVTYALRLGAGFGSQISMSLIQWLPMPDGQRRSPQQLGYAYRIVDQAAWKNWLHRITGNGAAGVEVYKRTLRVKDAGAARMPEAKPVAPAKPKPAPTPIIASSPSAAPATPGAPTPAPAAAPATPAPAIATDAVKDRVLQVIAKQTGYPVDMLDMELDLEADLGIDTVKQAEMFAAVREEYNIERDDDLQLRDFNTIERVIGFVYDKRPELKQATAAPAPVAQTAAAPVASAPVAAPADNGVKTRVLQLIADQTGYPIDMLDMELDLEADLGIDTVKQAEMFAAVREEYGIERDDDLQLRDFNTIERVIGFVYDKRPDLKQTAAAPAPVAQTPAAPVASVPVAAPADDGVKSKVLQLIADQTGYPIDMLDLELDLEADLGIDTVKQAEMFAAVREEYGIERDDDLQLRDFNTIERVIGFVYDKRPDLKQTAAAPASVAQTPTASAAPAPVAASGDEGVKSKVLQLIADQTGYPIDMLDLELDLEADLGIDTVKQAEMFAAVREEYSIERDDDLQLRDFNTIERVIGFVYSKRPDLNQAAPASKQVPAPVVDGRASSDYKPDVKFEAAIKGDMEATKTIARRVPTPMLRPEIDLCKATGVELDENSRVIVHTDQGGVGKALIK